MNAKKIVLLADDDRAIRLVAEKAFAKAQIATQSVASLKAMMAAVHDKAIAVLVSDIAFPDGDALEMLPEIKKARPDLRIILMSARSTLLTALQAQEKGVFAYLPKPFPLDELVRVTSDALGSASAKKSHTLESKAKSGAASGSATGTAPDTGSASSPLIGRSPAMQGIFRSIARLVKADKTAHWQEKGVPQASPKSGVPQALPQASPKSGVPQAPQPAVLITGESGTGKEVVAKALHGLGTRKNRPFVAINMAAIPRELIESELFGHEKGAFTGADRTHDGRFAQANGGTLFLDEIGDMPFETQTRLLRVLQDGSYTRVGGSMLLHSDVRIIAATNKDLTRLIADGLFREDLYYRLNVVPLHLPPLRERGLDIADFCQHFLARAKHSGYPAKTLAPDAVQALQQWHWPGNIRELENVIWRLVVLVDAPIIEAEHIRPVLESQGESQGDSRSQGNSLGESARVHIERFLHSQPNPTRIHPHIMAQVEKPLIELALHYCGGNQRRTAQLLGINRNTVRERIRTYNIKYGSD